MKNSQHKYNYTAKNVFMALWQIVEAITNFPDPLLNVMLNNQPESILGNNHGLRWTATRILMKGMYKIYCFLYYHSTGTEASNVESGEASS